MVDLVNKSDDRRVVLGYGPIVSTKMVRQFLLLFDQSKDVKT